MSLRKYGSAKPLKVVKEASFTVSENFLAEQLLKQVPTKRVSLDQLHSMLKSVGITNYSSEDLNILVGRLQAVGFKITQ